MRALGLLVPLAFSRTASAHEALADHAHPHGDWALTGVGLLAIGLVAAAILPVLATRRERSRK